MSSGLPCGRSSFSPLMAVLCLVGCSGDTVDPSGTEDGSTDQQAPLLGATPWHVPQCTSVAGAAPVTFTADNGATRAHLQEPLSTVRATAVAAYAQGSTLVAGVVREVGSVEVFFSTDAGCSWNLTHTITDMRHARIAIAGEYAFVWGYDDTIFGNTIYEIGPDGEGTRRPGPLGHWQSGGLHGLAADHNDPNRLRGAKYRCGSRPSSCNEGVQMVESLDRGATWLYLGVAPPFDSHSIVFSPLNLDHAIVIGAPHPAHATLDGGNQWFASQGLPDRGYPVTSAIAVDGQTAWLAYSNSSTDDQPALYLSRDGGLNFQEAPIPTGNDLMVGITHLFPHPVDADVLYLASISADGTTSRLDRYDARLQEVSRQEWPAVEGIVSSLAFNPADPDLIYIGLAREE